MSAWWLKRVLAARSLAVLRTSVGTTIERLGFQYFIYRSRFCGAPLARDPVCFDNCPPGWRAYYSQRGLESGFDPVCQRALRDVTPILWREVFSEHPALFSKAREFGMLTGTTHVVHGPGGQWSTVSFIKNYEGLQAERQILMALAKCQLLAAYIHKATARVVHRATAPVQRPDQGEGNLTDRECEVLALAAAGKTAAGIARILATSDRVVAFHLSNARRKLDAHNSRHAISKAISLGLIGVK